jgi:Ser/Thr protein kinase RdoA (MazF antagonist)
VFVKAEGEHREVHARNGNLFNEPLLAASGVRLPVDRPEPYGVVVDEAGLDWLVVMEDVTRRGGDPRDATRPMTVTQVAHGVRGLARLHDAFWGFSARSHPALAWVRTWAPTEGFQIGLRRRTPTGLERAGDALPREIAALTGDEVVDLWARYVGLLGRDPVTLLHADAHIGNTYVLPDDEVGFLDWQVARRGNWSQDVGHFLQGALVEADRRASERALLAAYVDELARDEVDGDEAWRWYRASALYGLAIWLSTLGTDGYQPRPVSLALAARFAAAAVELGAVDAVSELEARPVA